MYNLRSKNLLENHAFSSFLKVKAKILQLKPGHMNIRMLFLQSQWQLRHNDLIHLFQLKI